VIKILFLIILAIVPGLSVALYVYFKDKRNPLPPILIFQCAFYGVAGLFISIGLGLLLDEYSIIDDTNIVHQMIRAVIFVGMVEEGSKFIFLRGILFGNKRFTQPFDGIVFSVMIAMGFATSENILYIIGGGEGIVIIRMFTAVPAHAVFAVVMGFFIGEAKVFKTSSMLYSFMALFFATLIHGYYDYFLFLKFIPGVWFQALISLAILIVLTHLAFRLRKNEIIVGD